MQDTDTTLQPLLQHVAQHNGGGLNTIVHIGAGAEPDIEAYRQTGFDRLILVEGDTETAERLRTTVAGQDDIEVIEQMVAPQAGPVTWYGYNLPAVNGLQPPDDFQAIYPRLHVLNREQITAVAMPELLDRIDADTTQANLLVMDVTGQEDALLASIPEQQLHAFEWIAIRNCASEPTDTTDSDSPADTATNPLQAHGYRQAGQFATELDWPATLLHRDDTQLENTQLKNRLGELEAQIETAQANEQTLKAQLAQATTERDEQTARADESEAKIEQLHNKQQDLTTQLSQAQEQIKTLTDEKAAQDKQAAEQGAELEKRQQEHDEQIEKLTAQAEENEALATERQQQIENLQNQLQSEQKANAQKIETLEEELAEARRTTSQAVKLQTLREQDLKDLQERYEASLKTQHDQHQLLEKLSERLNVAAGYFHELADQDDNTTSIENDAPITAEAQQKTQNQTTAREG